MSAARSRRWVKCGGTSVRRSGSGGENISPLSTTTIDPSYSTTVMFLPISPRPPSGRTRRLTSDGAQQALPLEHRATRRLLVVARLDERQPQPAHVVAEHVQRRLERDRAGGQRHKRVDHLGDL